MARQTLTAVYFILTFLGGAAVGSWALWVYLMGAAGGAAPVPQVQSEAPPPVITPAPVAAPTPAAVPPPEATAAEPETVKLRPPPADGEAAERAQPEAQVMATPRKEPIAAVRSHEECLALTKELNDAYKDCRFGAGNAGRTPE